MEKRLWVLAALVFAMAFTVSSVMADNVGGVTGFSATGYREIFSITYGGTTYSVDDLFTGTTTRYDVGWNPTNPPAGTPTGCFSHQADNFSFDDWNFTSLSSNINPSNPPRYLRTIFDQPASIFFILEGGGSYPTYPHPSGQIRAITGVDGSGQPDSWGSWVGFSYYDYYNSNWYTTGWSGNEFIGVLAFETIEPVYGFEVEAPYPGPYPPYMDFCSNTAVVPIPGTAWLLISGLIGLMGYRRIFRS